MHLIWACKKYHMDMEDIDTGMEDIDTGMEDYGM